MLRNLFQISKNEALTFRDLLLSEQRTITINRQVKEALDIMKMYNLQDLAVVDRTNNLLGFLSSSAIFEKFREVLR